MRASAATLLCLLAACTQAAPTLPHPVAFDVRVDSRDHHQDEPPTVVVPAAIKARLNVGEQRASETSAPAPWLPIKARVNGRDHHPDEPVINARDPVVAIDGAVYL